MNRNKNDDLKSMLYSGTISDWAMVESVRVSTFTPGLQVMADDFTTSSTLRGLEWDAAQVRLKERWSAKVHVECEGVSALQAFLVVLCESSAE